MWPSASRAITTWSSTLVAHLHGAADVGLDPLGDARRRVDLRLVDGFGQRLERLHPHHTLRAEDEGRLNTAPRMARATASFPARGHRVLRSGGDDGHLVVRGVEADAGRADVVEHDGVQALAPELLARAGGGVGPGLGGEAHDHLVGAPALGQGGQHVVRALELEREHRPRRVLGDLVLPRVGGAVVRHRGGHEQDVAAGQLALARVLELGRGLHVDVADAGPARQRRRWRR